MMEKIKIRKIAVFFNNIRGEKLFNYLKLKKYQVFPIITKKFLNKSTENKIKKKNKYLLIKNLNNKNLFKFLNKQKFDLLIAAGFPHIFKKKYLKLGKFGIINLHAGKLPKYRGGSPLNWQIINNEKKIGLSIIKLDSKIDQGPIICEKSFINSKNDHIFNIHKKANQLFLKMTIKSIRILEQNKKLKKQKTSKSYFKQRSDKDGKINFNDKAKNIYNFVRALSYPYKGAFFFHKRKKIRIFKCKINGVKTKFKIGKIFKIKKNKNTLIKCKDKNIEILRMS